MPSTALCKDEFDAIQPPAPDPNVILDDRLETGRLPATAKISVGQQDQQQVRSADLGCGWQWVGVVHRDRAGPAFAAEPGYAPRRVQFRWYPTHRDPDSQFRPRTKMAGVVEQAFGNRAPCRVAGDAQPGFLGVQVAGAVDGFGDLTLQYPAQVRAIQPGILQRFGARQRGRQLRQPHPAKVARHRLAGLQNGVLPGFSQQVQRRRIQPLPLPQWIGTADVQLTEIIADPDRPLEVGILAISGEPFPVNAVRLADQGPHRAGHGVGRGWKHAAQLAAGRRAEGPGFAEEPAIQRIKPPLLFVAHHRSTPLRARNRTSNAPSGSRRLLMEKLTVLSFLWRTTGRHCSSNG